VWNGGGKRAQVKASYLGWLRQNLHCSVSQQISFLCQLIFQSYHFLSTCRGNPSVTWALWANNVHTVQSYICGQSSAAITENTCDFNVARYSPTRAYRTSVAKPALQMSSFSIHRHNTKYFLGKNINLVIVTDFSNLFTKMYAEDERGNACM